MVANTYQGSGNNPVASISWDGEAVDRLIALAIFKPGAYNYLDALRDLANNTATVEDAEYGSAVHPIGSANAAKYGAGAFVYTKNYKARLDEAINGTLMKVMGQGNTIASKAIGADRRYAPTRSGLRQRGSRGYYVKG